MALVGPEAIFQLMTLPLLLVIGAKNSRLLIVLREVVCSLVSNYALVFILITC